MLSIGIHLDHISIILTYCVFISKLQTTAISQIKHMSYYLMISFLHYVISRIGRCIIHDQNIRDLCNLRLFQFFQQWNNIFFFIICRNNDQNFFFVFHDCYSFSFYSVSVQTDIKQTSAEYLPVHLKSSLRHFLHTVCISPRLPEVL